MITPEKIDALTKAKADLISAKARNMGVLAAKEKMKNLLFNHYEDLVEAAVEAQRLQAEVSSLEAALEEMDQENDEMRKKLKEAQEYIKKGNAENAEG